MSNTWMWKLWLSVVDTWSLTEITPKAEKDAVDDLIEDLL